MKEEIDFVDVGSPDEEMAELSTPSTSDAAPLPTKSNSLTSASLIPIAPATTPSATPLTSFLTPVGSSQRCKNCISKAKWQNLQRTNKRLNEKVAELQKTIRELQSVSMIIEAFQWSFGIFICYNSIELTNR